MNDLTILYSVNQIPINCKIAIYGSGKIGVGFRSIVEKERKDVQVSCYINTFKSGVQGKLSILKLVDLENYQELFDIIIVCSSQWNEIAKELRNKNLIFCVISNEIIYNTLDICTLGSFRFDKENRKEKKIRLQKVSSFFDKSNQKYFKLLMDLRLKDNETEIFEFLSKAHEIFKNQFLDYFDKNLKENIILEGGVFDGADSHNFYNYFSNVNLKIIGFEPFMEDFNKSTHYDFLIKKGMEIFPYALWDKNMNLSFHQNILSSSSSSIIRNGNANESQKDKNVIIQAVTIDSFVEENELKSISLIKLDIEGAEIEALKGAERTIKRFKPQIAVAIYHKKEDLYEIPELLKKNNPNYRFALGFYSPTFIDTVLYALT